MKKRIISTIMATMVAASLVTGCSSKTEGTTKASNEPIKITFWHGMSDNLGTSLDKLVKDFNDTHKDIVVTAQYQGEYDDALNKLKSA